MTAVAIMESYPGVDWVTFWCPGCVEDHSIPTNRDDGRTSWDFNGDPESPTVSPSLLVNPGQAHPGAPVCHSFIAAGVWQFLPDSTHHLAGQHVPMVRGPHWP